MLEKKEDTPQNFCWKSTLVVTNNADFFIIEEIYSET